MQYRTFHDFWPFYLREHSRKATRTLHLTGSTLGMAVAAVGCASGVWLALPLAFVCGYGFAWIAHFGIEKNRPATFKHPFYSFAADWKMWALAVSGRLNAELRRHGINAS